MGAAKPECRAEDTENRKVKQALYFSRRFSPEQNDTAVKASFIVTEKIAKSAQLFPEEEFHDEGVQCLVPRQKNRC